LASKAKGGGWFVDNTRKEGCFVWHEWKVEIAAERHKRRDGRQYKNTVTYKRRCKNLKGGAVWVCFNERRICDTVRESEWRICDVLL